MSLPARLAALEQTANVVRVLAVSFLVVGVAGAGVTIVAGFVNEAAVAVLVGVGAAFVVVLVAALLLLAANAALAWSAAQRT